jgi:hypothetical protein
MHLFLALLAVAATTAFGERTHTTATETPTGGAASRSTDLSRIHRLNETWQRGNDDYPEGNYETAKFDFEVIASEENGNVKVWFRTTATQSTDYQHAGRDALTYGLESVEVLKQRTADEAFRQNLRDSDRQRYEYEVAQQKETHEQKRRDIETELADARKKLDSEDPKLSTEIAQAKMLIKELETDLSGSLVRLQLAQKYNVTERIKTAQQDIKSDEQKLLLAQEALKTLRDRAIEIKKFASKMVAAKEVRLKEFTTFEPAPFQPKDYKDITTYSKVLPSRAFQPFKYQEKEFDAKARSSGPLTDLKGQKLVSEIYLGSFPVDSLDKGLKGNVRITRPSQMPKHLVEWKVDFEDRKIVGLQMIPMQPNGQNRNPMLRFESSEYMTPDGEVIPSTRKAEAALPQKPSRVLTNR